MAAIQYKNFIEHEYSGAETDWMQSQAVLEWRRERDQAIRDEDCGAR